MNVLCINVHCFMCILVYFISVYIVCFACPSAIWQICSLKSQKNVTVNVQYEDCIVY